MDKPSTNQPTVSKLAMNKQFINNYTKNVNVSASNNSNPKPPSLPTLDSIIKPLATITPTNVSQKTDCTQMELKNNPQQDLQNDINYKTIKHGTFVKKKGTGTTPKALKQQDENKQQNNQTVSFNNNPWLKNDKKNKHVQKPKPKPKPYFSRAKSAPESSPPPPVQTKLKRQLTPIVPIKFKVKPKSKIMGKSMRMTHNKPLPSAPMNKHTQKYWVKPKQDASNNKPMVRNQLARTKPLSDHRKIELKENASIGVKDKEKDVLKWVTKY